MADLRRRWGCSHMLIHRLMKSDSEFPRPFKFEANPHGHNRWFVSDIENFERAMVKRRAGE